MDQTRVSRVSCIGRQMLYPWEAKKELDIKLKSENKMAGINSC